MALVLANRVQESATANTTVSFTLTGAVLGFQTFAVIGDTNTTYYSATDTSGNWEVGLGTYATSGPTLTRTTIYASSNSNTAVTFPGTVSVFVTYPSGKSVNLDGSGNVSALGTVASGTWQGSTIGVSYGGTGVTASSGANSVVLRDSSQNITVNRINQGLQTTTASGGTTVLTVASQFNQALVGTGGHTFQLPDATTLSDTTAFQFNNNATGTLTIVNNASGAVGTIAAGGAAGIALLSNATVAGTWDVHAYIPENVTWGTNALALGSTVITGGTWQGGTIASGYGGTGLTTFTAANYALYSTSASALTAGTLPVAAGGTGLTSGTSGGVLYYSASGTLASSAALAANSLVKGGGAGVAPSTITTGTDVITALGVNVGTAGSFVVNGGALGTPLSGTVTNLTGTASININGTVGATTPNTGAFTSITSTSASGVTTIQAATQDGVKLLGRAGGTGSYFVTLTPTTLSSSTTLTLPNVNDTVAVIGTAQTFTAAQTFRAASAIRSEAAATQDAIVLAGRAGGTSSYAVTLTPATLSASRTVTLADGGGNYTLGYQNLPAVGTKTGSYSLGTGDVGKYVQVGSGGSITVPNSTFAEGDIISIFNNTTGNVTLTMSITTAYIAGTDADKDTLTLATRGVATILFISGTVCVVSGNVT